MALNNIFIQELKEYPDGIKGVFVARGISSFVMLYSEKHGGYILRETVGNEQNISKDEKIRLSDLLYSRYNPIHHYGVDTNDSISVSGFFEIQEVVHNRYSIDYDIAELENRGFKSISEYIEHEGGNPWDLEGDGVIESIYLDETLDYISTNYDSLEIGDDFD